jgi:hypothetical protein
LSALQSPSAERTPGVHPAGAGDKALVFLRQCGIFLNCRVRVSQDTLQPRNYYEFFRQGGNQSKRVKPGGVLDMRKKSIVLSGILLGVLFLAGCDGIKTSVGFEQAADFTSYQTFSWLDQKNPGIKETAHQIIMLAVEEELRFKGLEKDYEKPDLHVVYYADGDEHVRVDTTYYGYAYGPGWYGGPYYRNMYVSAVGSRSTVREYVEGTLIVDLVDTSTNQLVWRGSVTGTVDRNSNAVENLVRKGLNKVFKKFPPPVQK